MSSALMGVVKKRGPKGATSPVAK